MVIIRSKKIVIRYKFFSFSLVEIWFDGSDYQEFCKILNICSIKYSLKSLKLPYFYKEDIRYTLLHDLTGSEDLLLNSFSRDTKNQISRAEKIGISWKINDVGVDEFVFLYNIMAKKKNIEKMSQKRIVKYGLENLSFFSAYLNEELLVINVYIHDKKKTRALYSVSLIHKNINKEKRQTIGFANKMLHWRAMQYFKKQNYELYDFGGYGNDKTNKALLGVDRFKKSFNGTLVRVYSYYSLPFRFLLFVKSVLS